MSEQALAYLYSSNKMYFASHETDKQKARCQPVSAVTSLIQGIYALLPLTARAILRNRIYTTAKPTEMCLGMVRVAAKRLSIVESVEQAKEILANHQGGLIENVNSAFSFVPCSQELPPQVASMLGANQSMIGHETWLRAALALAAQIPKSEELYLSHRPVAAILVSEEGSCLGWATNSNAHNKTLHAEVNLVQGYFARQRTSLPQGCRVYTTLKPCRMCAGMLWSAYEPLLAPRLSVYFAHDDPGPLARGSLLENSGQLTHVACGQ